MGEYPLESVQMLAKIAAATEPHRIHRHFEFILKPQAENYKPSTVDLIAGSIENIFASVDSPAGILAPTSSGYMARSLTRFRLPVWIIAISTSQKTCRDLMFSYGVCPVLEATEPEDDWAARARDCVKNHGLKGTCFIKAEGPSPDHPDINHKMEIIEL
jgi:pyruvate kinase